MQVYNDFPLSEILWYKVGGKAKYFLPAQTREELLWALDFIEKNHPQKIFLCGLGSNLIFSDEYFDGAVIQIAKMSKGAGDILLKNSDGLIESFAGESLDSLIQFSLENNMTGLEWAGGLPGTVGAGVRGNVGAFGGEIKDSFVSAEILTLTDNSFELSRITKDKFNFSYRNSVIKEQKNLIVVSSLFETHPENAETVAKAREVYEANIDYRKTHHPIEYPTCGSVFKNISDKQEVEKILIVWPEVRELVETKWHGKVSMGYINKRLGFSGYRIGNMEVSTKHANFIINLGDAKATDVLTIISHIQEKVSATFDFVPEVEVEVVK